MSHNNHLPAGSADDDVTTVQVWNPENGGRQPDGSYKLAPIASVVREVGPSLLFLQEAWGWNADGGKVLRAFERLIGMRGYLTPSNRGPLHEVVFVAPHIHVSQHWPRMEGPEGMVFQDKVGFVVVHVPGFPHPWRVRSVQAKYSDGNDRLGQALDKVNGADSWVIEAGDFNSVSADSTQGEFKPDWERLPLHGRSHKTLPPGLVPAGETWVSDTRATDVFRRAGYIDVGAWANDPTVTINAHINDGQGARIDLAYVGKPFEDVLVPGSYRVLISDLIDEIGDHRPLVFQVDPKRLSGGPQ